MSLKVSNLAKRYDDNWVLRDVTFEALRGEVTGIFGATSQGKTTLIRVLAGSEENNGGVILYDSHDVTKLSCEDRNFQLPSLRNDSFWKSIFKTHKSSELSDGDGQILALEDALEKARAVLLLDDTFCFMDRQRREIYFDKVRRAAQEKNLTVIFATNDFEEVFATCDRVAVLSRGDIQQSGTPREVYENPVNSEVARIAGRNNLIPARRLTSSKTETPEFQTIEGEYRLFAAKTEKQSLGAINQNVFLAIRPEHISISFGASFPEDNLLKATIREIKYQGSTTLVELDANGLILKALVLRLVGLNMGDECMVGLPPDRILVLRN
jgi:spermidine/putrescine transport system ATP-binding protein